MMRAEWLEEMRKEIEKAERLYKVSKMLNVSMEDLIEDKYRQLIVEEKIKDLQEELANMRGEE